MDQANDTDVVFPSIHPTRLTRNSQIYVCTKSRDAPSTNHIEEWRCATDANWRPAAHDRYNISLAWISIIKDFHSIYTYYHLHLRSYLPYTISVAIIGCWSNHLEFSLPETVRAVTDKTAFKRVLKTHFLNIAFNSSSTFVILFMPLRSGSL